jgi:hypothetical protein
MPPAPVHTWVAPRVVLSRRALRQAVFTAPSTHQGLWDVVCVPCGPVETGVSLARARWAVKVHTCSPAVPRERDRA